MAELPDISFTKELHTQPYDSISPTRPDLSAQGRGVLIIGAESDVGQATAVAFVKAGAKTLVLCGTRFGALEATKTRIATEVTGHQTRMVLQTLDNADQDAVHDGVRTAAQIADNIHIMVDCTSHFLEPVGARSTRVSGSVSGIELNIKGALQPAHAFVQHCVKSDEQDRVIICLSSTLSDEPSAPARSPPTSHETCQQTSARLAELVAQETPMTLRVYATCVNIVQVTTNDQNDAMDVNVQPRNDEARTQLAAGFHVWLASPRGAKMPSGRALYVNWDVDELEERAGEFVTPVSLDTNSLAI